jgi:hypothetical protein
MDRYAMRSVAHPTIDRVRFCTSVHQWTETNALDGATQVKSTGLSRTGYTASASFHLGFGWSGERGSRRKGVRPQKPNGPKVASHFWVPTPFRRLSRTEHTANRYGVAAHRSAGSARVWLRRLF